MRDGAPTDVLAGSSGWVPSVASWLGGSLLSGDVPVTSGRVTASVEDRRRVRLSMTVPEWTAVNGRKFYWAPGANPEHPLATYGQELDVSVTVLSSIGGEWSTRVGRFLITDWEENSDGSLSVTGDGLLRRVDDAKLTTPSQPRPGATLMTEARRLAPLGVSVAFDEALVDRAVPGSLVWESDRMAAFESIADAWPALLRVDEWGQVVFRAPLPDVPTPVLTLKDGERGTVVGAPRADTREGAYNEVVARSSNPDREDVQAVVRQESGPMSATGPYGPVTREWSSPLISTTTQAFNAAQTMVRNSLRPTRVLPVTHAPDPRIDLDDPVEVIRDGVSTWGYVTGYDLPLTATDGLQRTDVGVSS
jgi:hypothetical protein